MSRTLFDLTDEILALHDLLTDIEGEIPNQEIEDELDKYFSELEQDLDAKLDAYANLMAEFDATEEMCKREAARYQARAKTAGNNRDRLKDRLKLHFELTGKKKHKTLCHSFAICPNGGVQPLTVEVEPEKLPDEYRVIRYEADNGAIREALAAGEKLEFAHLEERGTHLRVR